MDVDHILADAGLYTQVRRFSSPEEDYLFDFSGIAARTLVGVRQFTWPPAPSAGCLLWLHVGPSFSALGLWNSVVYRLPNEMSAVSLAIAIARGAAQFHEGIPYAIDPDQLLKHSAVEIAVYHVHFEQTGDEKRELSYNNAEQHASFNEQMCAVQIIVGLAAWKIASRIGVAVCGGDPAIQAIHGFVCSLLGTRKWRIVDCSTLDEHVVTTTLADAH